MILGLYHPTRIQVASYDWPSEIVLGQGLRSYSGFTRGLLGVYSGFYVCLRALNCIKLVYNPKAEYKFYQDDVSIT